MPLDHIGRGAEPTRTASAMSAAVVGMATTSNLQPTIGGTRNRPSSACGAPASTSSRSRHGSSTSSRITLTSGYGCVIGSTSERSRASISAKWSSMSDNCVVAASISSGVRSSRARRATLATTSLVMRSDTTSEANADVTNACSGLAPCWRTRGHANRVGRRHQKPVWQYGSGAVVSSASARRTASAFRAVIRRPATSAEGRTPPRSSAESEA